MLATIPTENNTLETQITENSLLRLQELAEDTKRRLKRTVEDIYHIGLNLIEAKDMLGHGGFLGWLKEELAIDPGTASNFINVTKMLQTKFGIIPNLTTQDFPNLAIAPTVLYELAAPSTPDEARDEIINKALDGEKITVLDAKRIIKAYKTPPRLDLPSELVQEIPQDKPNDHPSTPWLTISQNHPHLAGHKCRVKYESSPGQLMCEVEDGSTVLIGARFLDEEPEPLSIPKKETMTFEEHKQIVDQLERDYELKIQSLRTKAPMELEIEYEELQESYARQLSENTKLLQEVQALQNLRKLETENEYLRSEVKRLEHAAADIPNQRWQGTLNDEAAKVVNKQVALTLEKFPPSLHLRSVATNLPEIEDLPEVLDLMGQSLQKLVPLGLKQYRNKLAIAVNWEEIEPVTQYWVALKANIWTELTQAERIQIKKLKEGPTHRLPVGARVFRVGGDPYDAEYGLHGQIVGLVSSDFRILWTRADGTTFEKRQSPDEIDLIKEVA